MSKTKIAIIGSEGYVGKAMVALLENHYEIVKRDPELEIRSAMWALVNESELAIICVPTLQNDDGSANLSEIEDTIENLKTPLILIKSTVPPETTRKLSKKYPDKNIAFSPEYIGEGKYYVPHWKYPHPTEIKHHTFMIVGGLEKVASAIIDLFVPVLGPDKEYIITDSTSAELTKYMVNCWGAMKVSFCNEFYDIAKLFDVDYNVLRELFLKDSRTERMHTAVFPKERGFGGKCFPKDVNAIVKEAKRRGYNPKVLGSILKFNEGISSDPNIKKTT